MVSGSVREKSLAFLLLGFQVLQGILVLAAHAGKSLLRCTGVIIRHKDLLKVHGSVGRIDLASLMLRHKVDAPDILVVFITFQEDGVQVVVNVFLEFLVILFLDTSEMKMNVFQVQNRGNIIIDISEWTYDPQGFFQGGTFLFQFSLFLLELLRLSSGSPSLWKVLFQYQ